jgi:hypothetical protein
LPVLEQLETRTGLAGNVTAVVSGGDLIVRGDDAGADITLSQPGARQITLTGTDTTVNGSAGPVTFSGVTKDLRIYFGSGDDSLTFDESTPISLSGNLFLNGGGGSNTVSTQSDLESLDAGGSLNVGGNLNVLNPAGRTQLISLLNLNVKGDVHILNLGGDALTRIESFDGSNTVGGSLLIANGPGQSSETDLRSINVKGDVHILNQAGVAIACIDSFGGSNSVGGDLAIIDGPGQISQTVIGSTMIDHDLQVVQGGQDQNTILVLSTRVKGTTNLRSRNGDDTVFVNNTTFGGAFHLQTGQGTDTVVIGTGGEATLPQLVPEQIIVIQNGVPVLLTQLVVVPEQILIVGGQTTYNGQVIADLGDGDDTLNLAVDAVVSFNEKATLDGQNGDNMASVHVANLAGAPMLKDFQVNMV